MREPLIAWKPNHTSVWIDGVLRLLPRAEAAEIARPKPTEYTVPDSARAILAAVARDHSLTVSELQSPSSDPVVKDARRDAVARLKNYQGAGVGKGRVFRYSYGHIAHILNMTDHTVPMRLIGVRA